MQIKSAFCWVAQGIKPFLAAERIPLRFAEMMRNMEAYEL